MTTETMQAPDRQGYPATISAVFPEKSNKLLALAGLLVAPKGILLIPHLILLFFLIIAEAIAVYVAFWIVLITGSYPRLLFNFSVGVQNWSTRATFWFNSWVDKYPPFGFGADDDYPVKISVPYPENPSRPLALLGALLVIPKLVLAIPHALIIFLLVNNSLIVFAGFLIVLFSGKYPKGIYDFQAGVVNWQIRITAWVNGWVDKYPPFELEI